jgi:polar amino acid transport system permease protein
MDHVTELDPMVVGATVAAPTTDRSDSPPPASRALALVALSVAGVTVLCGWFVFSVAAEQAASAESWMQALCIGAATVMPLLLLPPIFGLRDSIRAQRLWHRHEVVESRHLASSSRGRSLGTFGYVGAVAPVLVGVTILIANDGAVRTVFFSWDLVQQTFGGILKALLLNLQIAVSAMIIVLVLGLVVAIGRLLPGRSFRPIRLLAIGWVDLFRAIPAVILIYLIGFGLPLTGLPVIGSLSPVMYAILALSLTYSAYVAETYRAGIESIHPSQVAAGRSLGLSSYKTMRLVVLPQAVRRIVPSLLTFFVGMQKDTALVGVLGLVDAFAQARIYSANYFNLTPVMVVCGLFIILTIPQTRFVDALLSRDQRRREQ